MSNPVLITPLLPAASKLLSCLLHYPQPVLVEALPQFRQALSRCRHRLFVQRVGTFLAYLARTELPALQTHFTEVFDMSRDCCLNLTYHRYGENGERGPALAQLQDVYRQAGLTPVAEELPDYLPLMLEFTAVGPVDRWRPLVRQYRPAVAGLTTALEKRQSPYAPLLAATADLWGRMAADGSAPRPAKGANPCTP